MRCLIVSVLALVFLSSCSSKQAEPFESDSKGVRFSKAVGQLPGIESQTLTIARSEFLESLESGRGVNGPRMIEVFRREKTYPEWRCFDIQEGDPFHTIGLRERDVLLAANDFIIFDPNRFRAYVRLLPSGFEAQVLVRREGKIILLEPKISPEKPGSSPALNS